MRHLKSLQINESKLVKDADFWQEIDNVLKTMIKEDNFYAFHSLKDKYPKFYNLKTEFHDKALVPLHNTNRVKKRISIEEKIIMYVISMACYGHSKVLRDSYLQYPDFKTWFETAILKVFRGVPLRKEYKKGDWVGDFKSNNNLELKEDGMTVQPGSFKSFTLDFETAVKFTQQGWAAKSWIRPEERIGYIFEGHIKPCDIHIFQNEGREQESVIKGPFQCDKVHLINKGKII